MKNDRLIKNSASLQLPTEKANTSSFRCPDCLMADTCADCCMHGSDGKCLQFGGYTDNSKWACPWYYQH